MINLINVFPLYNLYQCYKSISSASDPQYDRFENDKIKPDERLALEKCIEPTLKKYGLKNVVVITGLMKDDAPAFTAGAACLNPRRKIICINRLLGMKDIEAAKTILKHEVGHVVHNDQVKNPVILLTISAALSILSPLYGFTSISSILIEGISIVALSVFLDRKGEINADDFSIENSTVEELKGGIRAFTAMKMHYVKERQGPISKLFISTEGEDLLSIWHPSHSDRLAKYKAAYLKRTGEEYIPQQKELEPFLEFLDFKSS